MSITDEEYENPWLVGDARFSLSDEELEKYVGFVYLIQGLTGDVKGKKYVGQKLLWSKKVSVKTNPKTKIKKKTKRRVPSDWKSYYGSSQELQADVQKHGVSSFRREILHLCSGKGDMNYLEMREQIMRNVLLKEDYYNSFVGGKIHRRHLSDNIEELK